MFYKQSLHKKSEDGTVSVDFTNMNAEFSPLEAFEKVKALSKDRKFPESIDAIVKLNIDPTKGD